MFEIIISISILTTQTRITNTKLQLITLGLFLYSSSIYAQLHHQTIGALGGSQSQGCLNLIKTKNAHLVSNPADIPYILNWSLETQQKVVQKKLFVELDSDEKIIYNYLKKENKSALDVIAIACEMPTSKVAYLLLNLELKGVCRPLPGKEFELV